MGTMVTFSANGTECDGYLAFAAGASGPGVIVIQEWWGLVPHIKDVADRLADAGFVALAPDLYHGETAEHPDEAQRHMMGLRIDEAATELSGAVDYLLACDEVAGEAIGVIGFCLGGGLALVLGTKRPDVKAIVDYYGILPGSFPDLRNVRASVLGQFGLEDPYIGPEVRADLRAQLEAAAASVRFEEYPAGHAFFNDTRPDSYDEASARSSWAKTIEFLKSQLTTSVS